MNSAFLVVARGMISIPLSIAIGAYAALKREKVFDSATSILTLLLAALPEFVVGLTLVVLFATTVFHVLPASAPSRPGPRPWNN